MSRSPGTKKCASTATQIEKVTVRMPLCPAVVRSRPMLRKGDLHGEQDAEDGEGLPLAGAEAQVRLGEQRPAQDHDPADDKPHRAQAQGRGVVETDLGRDRQATPQNGEQERKEGCRDGERAMLRRSGASSDRGPPG